MCSGKRKTTGEDCGNVLKKVKSDTSLEHPAFYYSIHRHSIRGMNMPKLVSAKIYIHCHVLMYNDTNVVMQAEFDTEVCSSFSGWISSCSISQRPGSEWAAHTLTQQACGPTPPWHSLRKCLQNTACLPTHPPLRAALSAQTDVKLSEFRYCAFESLDSTEVNCGYFYWRVFLFFNDNLSKFWIRNNSFIWMKRVVMNLSMFFEDCTDPLRAS